ncbi:hypothetical protein EMCRGX_G012300 [Ephydatia muelleri]
MIMADGASVPISVNPSASGSVRQKKCCSCNGIHARCIVTTLSPHSSASLPPQPQPPQPLPQLPPEPPPSKLFISKGMPCIVQGCSERVAPTMWKAHMANHAKGLFVGEVPAAWLRDNQLQICDMCSDLVAISQLPIHQQSCRANQLKNTDVESMLVDSQVQPADLPSFEEICGLRCPTLRFIPHRAKPSFARVLSSVLFDIILQNSVTAWKKLFMLPKCVLPTAKRAGRHNHPVSIELLCDLWSKGHLSQLWQRAMSRGSSPRSLVDRKKDSGQLQVSHAVSLSQDGLFGKALGEALRRLVGKCLCSMLKRAEKIAHGLRGCMDENWQAEGFTVLKIDLVNAFNLPAPCAVAHLRQFNFSIRCAARRPTGPLAFLPRSQCCGQSDCHSS